METTWLAFLSPDLLEEIASYLDVKSITRLSAASRLFNMLGKEIMDSQAAWVAEAGLLEGVLSDVQKKLTVRPSVGILYVHRWPFEARLLASLPPDICLIGGVVPSSVLATKGSVTHPARYHCVLSLGHFPEAEATSFLLNEREAHSLSRNARQSAASSARDRHAELRALLGLRDNVAYRVFIVNAGYLRSGGVEDLLELLQEAYPGAAILGGIVSGDVFHLQGGRLRSSARGIVGVAFAGNVPIETVVSRGVSAVGPVFEVDMESVSLGVESDLRIRRVALEGQASQSAPAVVSQLDEGGQVHYVGVRCGGDHAPFVIRDYEVLWDSPDEAELVVPFPSPPPSSSSLPPLALRVLRLEPRACRQHVAECMGRVKNELHASGRRLIGALMFSCNARGPSVFIDRRESAIDARAFSAVFPDVPLTGFYAGGEIGPQAVYWDAQKDAPAGDNPGPAGGAEVSGVARRCSQTGDVALQSFTCMFAMLVVPKKERASSLMKRLAQASAQNASPPEFSIAHADRKPAAAPVLAGNVTGLGAAGGNSSGERRSTRLAGVKRF